MLVLNMLEAVLNVSSQGANPKLNGYDNPATTKKTKEAIMITVIMIMIIMIINTRELLLHTAERTCKFNLLS